MKQSNRSPFSPEERAWSREIMRKHGITRLDQLPVLRLQDDPVLRPLLAAAIREDPDATIEQMRKALQERNPTTYAKYEQVFNLVGCIECMREILQDELRLKENL